MKKTIALGLLISVMTLAGTSAMAAQDTLSTDVSAAVLKSTTTSSDAISLPVQSAAISPIGNGSDTQPVPEPGTIVALGAAASLFFARKKAKRS